IRGLGHAAGFPQLATTVTALALSSFIYIVGYFPIVPANHFRYIYWPALAMSMSAILIAAACAMARRARKVETHA
uniref:hypothetical protein n=1 Tax=Brevibacterium casei TaxID=33889 RepID=UPI001C92C0C9